MRLILRKQNSHYRSLVQVVLLASLMAVVSRGAFGIGCTNAEFGGTQINIAVGVSPRSIAAGDFNHDGMVDLAVANYGTDIGSTNGGISILINTGGGTYSNPTNLSGGINPQSIVSGDFNNDTHLDLAFVHLATCCVSSSLTILLGNGLGSFSASSPVGVGNNASSLAAVDLNNDGKLDLATTVTGSGFRSVAVLLGNGAGGFSAPNTFNTAGNAMSLAAGDVNGDGKRDIVTGNLNGFDISVLPGDGLGGLGAPNKFALGENPRFVALGDVNMDSKLDVVTANSSNNVAILLGTGTGTFGSATLFSVGASPQSVIIKDLNGDGRPDLATANSGSIAVLRGDGTGSFSSLTSYSGSSPFFITSADTNGDTKTDLVIADLSANSIVILLGDGLGGFTGARNFNAGSAPFSVAHADLNGDGKLDLVVPNSGQNTVSVLLGDGAGNFAPDVKFEVGFNPRRVAIGDFNVDGKLDLAVAINSVNPKGVSILLGNGAGGFGSPTTFDAGVGTYSIVSADFNKDGKLDVAVVNNADNNVSVLSGVGNGSFAAPINISLPGSPTDLALGDFNRDGNTDLAVANNSLSILIGNGANGFSVNSPLFGIGATNVAVGDVNSDGIADVATANSTGSVSVVTGNGMGDFGSLKTFTIASAQDIEIADANLDGKPDLVVTAGGTPATLRILPGDGTGDFGAASSFTFGSPMGLVVADFNGDGRLDVAAGFGRVSVLINSCTAPPMIQPTASIADVAVNEGNSGQTTSTFTVTLSAASLQTVTISYYTLNQSASAGSDYQSAAGHVTFVPGSVTQTITVPVIGDATPESNEQFLVLLTNAVNASVTDAQAVGTLLDDDALGLLLDTSGPAVNQAAALESLLLTRDPFRVLSIAGWWNPGPDQNTRVLVFANNLTLSSGETAADVTVTLVDSSSETHNLVAEDVRAAPNSNVTQVKFRLPNNLSAGSCVITIKAHGQTSNTGVFRIAP